MTDRIKWINLPYNGHDNYWRVDAINWFAKAKDGDGVQFTTDGDDPERPNLTSLSLDEFIERLMGDED